MGHFMPYQAIINSIIHPIDKIRDYSVSLIMIINHCWVIKYVLTLRKSSLSLVLCVLVQLVKL